MYYFGFMPFKQTPYIIGIQLSLLLVSGCQSIEQDELIGLWQLEVFEIDGYIKRPPSIFLNIENENSFALSKTSGDVLGFYKIDGTRVYFKSEEGGWFNTSWNMLFLKDHFKIEGLEKGFRVTKLTFRKINKIPDFHEFEEKILGEWALYKIREKNKIKQVNQTIFSISQDEYTINQSDTIVESGRVMIDTRHRKIVFENMETQWNAWFYGDELRLDNPSKSIQYDLRKQQ